MLHSCPGRPAQFFGDDVTMASGRVRFIAAQAARASRNELSRLVERLALTTQKVPIFLEHKASSLDAKTRAFVTVADTEHPRESRRRLI